MSKSQLVAIVIRLIAVYFIIRAISYIPILIDVGRSEAQMGGGITNLALPLAITVVVLILVMKFANLISVLLLPKGGEDALKWDYSLADVQIVAMTLLGLFVLSSSIPDLFYWLFIIKDLMGDYVMEVGLEQKAHVIASAGEIIIGLYLTLGARGLNGALVKLRSIGANK